MMPYVNAGEDAEAIADNLHSILKAVGDQAFARALLKERPKMRTAVRDCMYKTEVQNHYPATYQILHDAPHVKWPSDVAFESSGGYPTQDEEWTR